MFKKLGETLSAFSWVIRTIWVLGRNPVDLAEKDEMTGTDRREIILDRRISALDLSRITGQGVSFVVLDVDGLKTVNDQEGHEAGDRIISTVGKILRGSLRQGDFVGRTGGDEFFMIITGSAWELTEEIVQDRIVNPLSEAGISISYGVSHFSWQERVEEMTRRADEAMYTDKYERRRARVNAA